MDCLVTVDAPDERGHLPEFIITGGGRRGMTSFYRYLHRDLGFGLARRDDAEKHRGYTDDS